MSAKTLFMNLGYEQTREDNDYIIYEKNIDEGQNKKIVSFSDQLKSVNVSFELGSDTPSIDISLYKAITQQLNELGWILSSIWK